MPRGGARPGAGRKPNPDSARQRALAKAAAPAGGTLPDGTRAPGAPANWPFGTVTPSAEVDEAPIAAPEKPPESALSFLQSIYRDVARPEKERVFAAIQALPFETAKPAPVGKKAAQDEAARSAGPSKFGAMQAPRLVSSRT